MADTKAPAVLVVDDESALRHILRSLLQIKGCEVRVAASGEEATELLGSWRPDVALVDIVMPGKSGLELLREMRVALPDTQVLIMTSNPSSDTAVKAMQDGAYDYLKKPFELESVWKQVQRAHEQSKIGLRNRELLHEQEELSRELSAIATSSPEGEAEYSNRTYSEILDHFLDSVAKELDTDRISIMVLDSEGDHLTIAASRGIPTEISSRARVSIGQGIAGRVAQTGQAILATGLDQDDRLGRPPHQDLSDSFISAPIAMSVPIRSGAQTAGVINITNRRSGKSYDAQDLDYLSQLAGQLAVAIEGSRRFDQLQGAYTSLKSTQEQLVFAERLNAVGRMATGVAHDINNVLIVILARAELVLRKLGNDELSRGLRNDLDTIVEASKQGAEAITRLQDYTRVRRDTPTGVVDLNGALLNAVEITRPKWKELAEAEGKQIEIDLALSEVPPVQGNTYELTQVVNNLIFNAVEAMPDGGTLSFESFAEGDRVGFRVRDTGTGMDEQTRKHLFDPFFTTKETGHGLGTAILYGIVTRHGGGISVDSEPGRGTTFCVTLRRADPVDQQQPDEARSSDQGRLPARIMLVDDDDLVRETLEATLETAGHEVRSFSRAELALGSFAPGKFDVTLTDLSMSGMTGLELSKQLKQREPQMPVILLSGWAMHQDDQQIQEAGIDDVLLKPCMMDELLAAVQRALNRRVPA